jgi:tight adherence protein C
MMSWWMDGVFVVALAVLGWALYNMHRESQVELQPGERAPGEIRPGDWLRSLYPRKLIRQAGMLPENTYWFYWPGKLVLTLLLPLVVTEALGVFALFLFVFFALLGFFAVDLWLLMRRRSRRQRIGSTLGYFVDLIAAFLQSGMSLAQAFEQAARFGLPKKNPLSREVDLIARELNAGGDRVEAFHALYERTGVEDVGRLAALMAVGFRVGTPLGETLEAQAELLRARQWEQSEALVNRRALEALFPMMLVSLPLILVLVFFPAAVQIFDIFSQFTGAYG